MSTILSKALLKDLTSSLLSAYDEREAANIGSELLLHFAGLDRMKIALNEPLELHVPLKEKLDDAIERLLKNEPLQHILGEVEFYGLQIKTDYRALIPRPETEELVDWIISDQPGFEGSIIDIGTGTGCIPIALAHHLPKAQVSGLDLSAEALKLAFENARLNKVKISWHQGDVLNASLPGQFNLIVSNPPYIPEADKTNMAENVLDYEPDMALFVSNERPLIFYQRIAKLGLEHLNKHGSLYFEIHEAYGSETVQLLENLGYQNIILKQDLQGKDRMIKASRS